MVIGFIGVIGSDDRKDKENMLFMSVMAMGSFLVSVAFL